MDKRRLLRILSYLRQENTMVVHGERRVFWAARLVTYRGRLIMVARGGLVRVDLGRYPRTFPSRPFCPARMAERLRQAPGTKVGLWVDNKIRLSVYKEARQ